MPCPVIVIGLTFEVGKALTYEVREKKLFFLCGLDKKNPRKR